MALWHLSRHIEQITEMDMIPHHHTIELMQLDQNSKFKNNDTIRDRKA